MKKNINMENIIENNKAPDSLKKGLGALAIVGLLTVSATDAKAWFNISANIYVSSNKITAKVYNNSNRPWQCRGKVYGETQLGQWSNQWFNLNIYPGYYINPYLDTWGNAYFIKGNAEVQCRTINR